MEGRGKSKVLISSSWHPGQKNARLLEERRRLLNCCFGFCMFDGVWGWHQMPPCLVLPVEQHVVAPVDDYCRRTNGCNGL